MKLRIGSVELSLCALLIGTASTWALAPHDKAVGVQSHKQSESAVKDQEHANDDKGSAAPAPSLITPTKSTSTERDTGKQSKDSEQDGNEFWPAFLGYHVKISDSIVAVAAAVTALYTMRLWRSTEKLWDASERQMDLTRAALHGAETPYLIPIVRKFDPERDPAPDAGEGFVSYRFRNCGRSPAIILERYHSLGVLYRSPTPVCFPPPQGNLFKADVIGSNRKDKAWTFNFSSLGDWTPQNRTHTACLIGQVRYADVFGNQFLTNFCYLWNGHSETWYAHGVPACNARRPITPDEMVIALKRDSMPGQAGA